MSFSAAHESKDVRRACQICHERKARFRYRGDVRADRDHVLCFECYRSERDRRRARMMADVPSPRPIQRPFGATLTERQLAHRGAMLVNLRHRAGLGE
jgi:hypothetical protein